MELLMIARACGLFVCLGLAGCEEGPRMDMDCSSFDDDPSYQPTRGRFELAYDGFAGRAPKSGVHMNVRSTTAETVYLQGCGYGDDIYWWVDAAIRVPITVSPPAEFDGGSDAPSATAFMWSCGVYHCSESLRRTSLAAAQGTVHRFDPVTGILRADYSLRNLRPTSAEHGVLGVHADLTWVPDYAPKLEGTLDGRWQARSVERIAAGEDVELHFELLQSGPRLSVRPCDAEWACADGIAAGTFADPSIRATWSQHVETEGVWTFTLSVAIEQGGRAFSGRLQRESETRSSPEYWDVEGKRVE